MQTIRSGVAEPACPRNGKAQPLAPIAGTWARTTCLMIAFAGCAAWLERPAQAAPFVPPRDAHAVAFSPDGRLVVVGISGQSNGEFPPRPHPSPRKCGVVQWFDIASQRRLRRIETFGDVTQVGFSRNGQLVAAARLFTTDDGVDLHEVRVWDTQTGALRRVFDRCHAFTFLADPRLVAVASRTRCVTFDVETGERHSEFPMLAGALQLAEAAGSQSLLGIVVTESGCQVRQCGHGHGGLIGESSPLTAPFYSLAVPASGQQFATGHAGGVVVVWETATMQPAYKLKLESSGRAFPFFSPTGDLLAAADQSNSDVIIWNWPDGSVLARYTFRQGALHTYGSKHPARTLRPEEDPARFAFAPDGNSFAGGPFGGIVRLVTNGRDIARFGE